MDQTGASWNRLTSWLRQIDQLRLGIPQILALSNQVIVAHARWERHFSEPPVAAVAKHVLEQPGEKDAHHLTLDPDTC